jgi:hypothetical protein
MSFAVAITAPIPNARALAGSTIVRRRNENLRCRIAEGTASRLRRKTTPDIAAATAAICELSKNIPARGDRASARRAKSSPPTKVETTAVAAASSIRSRRWISAAIIPVSETSRVTPTRIDPAANSPKSAGVASRARAR